VRKGVGGIISRRNKPQDTQSKPAGDIDPILTIVVFLKISYIKLRGKNIKSIKKQKNKKREGWYLLCTVLRRCVATEGIC
jgi:hypothetical protein